MKPFLTLFTFLILITPSLVLGAENVTDDGIYTGKGLIPCGQTASNPCNSCDIVILANTIVKWVIGITFLIFAGMGVYTGLRMVTSGGNASAKEDAKEMFTNLFIGLFIILGAWLMIDTLLRFVLKGGENGEIAGYGPWSQVKCVEEATSTTTKMTIEEAEYVAEHAALNAASYSGSCNIPASGNCSPQTLNALGNGCFGSDVNVMSMICMRESRGIATAKSGTDLCRDGKTSWSIGLFQINILVQQGNMGCDGALRILQRGSSGLDKELGTCLAPRKPVGNTGKTYCPIRNCEIASAEKYNLCVSKATDPAYNVKFACNIYKKGGLSHWGGSAGICGL